MKRYKCRLGNIDKNFYSFTTGSLQLTFVFLKWLPSAWHQQWLCFMELSRWNLKNFDTSNCCPTTTISTKQKSRSNYCLRCWFQGRHRETLLFLKWAVCTGKMYQYHKILCKVSYQIEWMDVDQWKRNSINAKRLNYNLFMSQHNIHRKSDSNFVPKLDIRNARYLYCNDDFSNSFKVDLIN